MPPVMSAWAMSLNGVAEVTETTWVVIMSSTVMRIAGQLFSGFCTRMRVAELAFDELHADLEDALVVGGGGVAVLVARRWAA